jgi:hypothetical protein
MALITDPDDFYLDYLHDTQYQMLCIVKNQHHFNEIYIKYKDIIDTTLLRMHYRMRDRDILNEIRVTFLLTEKD